MLVLEVFDYLKWSHFKLYIRPGLRKVNRYYSQSLHRANHQWSVHLLLHTRFFLFSQRHSFSNGGSACSFSEKSLSHLLDEKWGCLVLNSSSPLKEWPTDFWWLWVFFKGKDQYNLESVVQNCWTAEIQDGLVMWVLSVETCIPYLKEFRWV